MKSNKLTILTLLLLPFCLVLSAQDTISQDDDVIVLQDSVIGEKLKLAAKLILANGHTRAFQLYSECAAEGNAYAMNAIGILKQRGWGTAQDEAGSIEYFEQAAKAGYAKAYYNLFNVYAKALGVEQNFENAVNYLDALQNTAQRTMALVWLGYYYYKGFGVEQDYKTAVSYFLEAAEDNHPDAFYFLGLCYRNGYGVEQNEAEAQYYLSRAAELGHYYSFDELQEETTEILPQPKNIVMQGGRTETGNFQISPEYRKIARQNINNGIQGEYVGTIVMYDYSGKHIVKTTDLKIRFDDTQNGKIYGQWIEADTLFTDFEAILTDSTLQFLNTEYKHTERYSKNVSKKWKFNNAILEKTDTESASYLVGNIQQYDMKLKEPSKPLYISLQKKKFPGKEEKDFKQVADKEEKDLMKVAGNNEKELAKFVDKEEKDKKVVEFTDAAGEEKNFVQFAEKTENDVMIAYPNPFGSEINILFSLDEEQNVTFWVYSVNGMLFDRHNLGILPEGKHNYLLKLSAPKGQYLLVLQKGNDKITNLIIKK